MENFLQNLIKTRKRKAENDLEYFRRQSKARRRLLVEDEDEFNLEINNIFCAFVCGCV